MLGSGRLPLQPRVGTDSQDLVPSSSLSATADLSRWAALYPARGWYSKGICDYVAKQYIGNPGKTANGIVSVNAYAMVDVITCPLVFKVFKPRTQLQPGDVYKTKPELAVEILQELQAWSFQIELVLADSLYGESGDVIRALERLNLPFIVAIRGYDSEATRAFLRWLVRPLGVTQLTLGTAWRPAKGDWLQRGTSGACPPSCGRPSPFDPPTA